MKRTIRHGTEYWTLYENGEIERPGLVKPSPAWRVTGAAQYNNFGNVVRRYTLEEILANPSGIPWQYANGKQRVCIRDFDHGSNREWRSPTHLVY